MVRANNHVRTTGLAEFQLADSVHAGLTSEKSH